MMRDKLRAVVTHNTKRVLGYDRVMKRQWRKRNPFTDTPHEWEGVFDPEGRTVGILWDIAQEHRLYIKACHELRVNYRVFDLRQPGWIDDVRASGIDWFLAWPTMYDPVHRQFWDDKLGILVVELKKNIYPEYGILWLYESKRRTAEWLEVHGYPMPETAVFFDYEQAMTFARDAPMPIVYKADQGAAASGVHIVRTRKNAFKLIRQAFGRGVPMKHKNPNVRHRGYVIFQEYLPDCNEWRIVRVGDSYFCRYKIREGDFHSGSGRIEWVEAPEVLLDMTREISDRHGFSNINIDFFEVERGEYLINELHALWGGKVIEDRELEGRYRYIRGSGWVFEPGAYFQNRCANLRVEYVIGRIARESLSGNTDVLESGNS